MYNSIKTRRGDAQWGKIPMNRFFFVVLKKMKNPNFFDRPPKKKSSLILIDPPKKNEKNEKPQKKPAILPHKWPSLGCLRPKKTCL